MLLLLLPGCSDDGGAADDDAIEAPGFTIASSSFADGAAIPQRHTCDGDGVSPQLTITGPPAGTTSLALTMKDHDVPTPQAPNRTINHWVVWNVTVGGAVFPEGSVPIGASEGSNDFGEGYLGPCPPAVSPPHRYNFTVYALDERPAVPDNATAAQLEEAMAGHILARTTLIGMYGRSIVPTTTPPMR
jgi:Raf kinase inhibitor-like YbhB/YbcL family protein